MKKTTGQKLHLRKTTITTLSRQYMSRIAGGAPITAVPSHQIDCDHPVFTEQINCLPFDKSDAVSCFKSCFVTQLSCNNSFQIEC
jgi:hypothetical protein